jgi:hypothetical protein
VADGRVCCATRGIACFAGDLSEQEQMLVWAKPLCASRRSFCHDVLGTVWKSEPSWYIVANDDRTVQPEVQRFVAKRMGANIHAIDGSHVPMLYRPDFVLGVTPHYVKLFLRIRQSRGPGLLFSATWSYSLLSLAGTANNEWRSCDE